MAKQEQTLSARDKARAIAQKSNKKSMGVGGKIAIALGAIVVAVAIIVGLIFVNQQSAPDFSAVNQPDAAQEYGVLVGKDRQVVDSTPEGVAEVVIYQDYNCPACGTFEENYAEEIDRLIDDEKATIEYRSLGMLDSASMGTNYSSRAANANLCVAQQSPESSAFYDMNKLLYSNQPNQGTKGLDNDHLVSLANSVGADSVEECIEGGTYRGYVRNATEYAIGTEQIEGTPTVLINGEKWELGGNLTEAVEEAIA